MPQVFEDDSIDLIALLRQLYLSRWLFVKGAAVAAVLGVVVALATPITDLKEGLAETVAYYVARYTEED